VAFLAVAHEAAAHQVLANSQAAMRFRDDVIQRWRAAEWITAVGALIIPSQVDLITGGPPSDQPCLLNPVLIHLDRLAGEQRGPLGRGCRRRCV